MTLNPFLFCKKNKSKHLCFVFFIKIKINMDIHPQFVIQDAGVALGALKPILVSKKSIMNLKFN
jgi:hypothetical protein